MATVPTSGTNIRLLSGVPFQSDYKNSRWFETKSLQTNYFTAKPIVHSMTEANFQRIEGKHFIAVNKSIDELWNTNYLMFQNSHYNNKWFYAFVTKLEYKQKNTTYVHFQIDVLQTWRFEMNFKPSFVVREHCRLWSSDGTPVINTVDEGLNYGTEYDTVYYENFVPHDDLFYLVIVAKNKMHGNYDGTTELPPEVNPNNNGLPQPLSYYIHPFRLNGTRPNVQINSSVTISPILDLLARIFKQIDAVNNIVSMYITDFTGLTPSYDGSTVIFNPQQIEVADIVDESTTTATTLYVKHMPTYNTLVKNIGNKYDGFKTVSESKLLMYPYTVLILDDFKGNRVDLKLEYIDSTDLILTVRGSMGTSNKVVYNVNRYNTGELDSATARLRVSLENALINNNPNDISILSDYLSAYLQGNRNTIEHQKTSIMWNSTMNMISSGIGGIGSAVSGNPIGAISSIASIATSKKDEILGLQGIEKKLQDINNIPPSIAKMGSNTAFDYGNNYKGVYIIKKQIKPEYRKKLSDFFNMYGYKVNEVKIPNFNTRQNWNYVQTSGCIITGNFNNEDLQELKNIFDNGITLWHTDDLGNYALSNEVK